jgi:hypothetical protein
MSHVGYNFRHQLPTARVGTGTYALAAHGTTCNSGTTISYRSLVPTYRYDLFCTAYVSLFFVTS